MDKRSYIDKLATEAEEAADKKDISTLYRISKTRAEGFTSSNNRIRNQQGEIISNETDKLQCWRDHFDRVLNREDATIRLINK